ncbi:PP2C family protein-serine/threonine phosphatase [Dyella japonica]|uniref:PP2C family protein-serine/threonine phosphatase n=1 Tax=Dyella japonica TaxID=231455 RepID=UPI00062DB273|nr:PP2C family serine/threonine-protein phosphatase [Dyella japonica]
MDKTVDFHAIPRAAGGRAQGGRSTQEDDLICLHDPSSSTWLLVLADGMGGDGAGELASRGVIQATRRLWEQGTWRSLPGPLFLETLCQQAHTELQQRGENLAGAEPHSTIVAVIIRGSRVSWAHVGDSRLYRFQGTRLIGRTEDHSLGQLKLQRGELSESELANDPDQHKLLRGLGGPQAPVVEHGFAELDGDQTFALCSDGVWERLTTEELASLSQRRDQHQALQEALAMAVERGGQDGDNVALIFAHASGEGWLRRHWNKLGSAMQRTVVFGRRVAEQTATTDSET